MNCFPCFGSKEESTEGDDLPVAQPVNLTPSTPPTTSSVENPSVESINTSGGESCTTKSYTFRELAAATKNFKQEHLLGEGGFGRLFKGTLQSGGQNVAIRQLDRNGVQESKEFVAEVLKLSLLEHPNLVNLVGYCADGDQRLLVYDYMPCGSLKKHLHDVSEGRKPLDWSTRMKIALGIAQGLEFLHEKAVPPLIYLNLKSSTVLLDEDNNPRLSEYGLARLVQGGNKMHVAGYGYCAPEHERNEESTCKSDVYSFGVILLEIITGRRAVDTSRQADEQNLVSWAQPIFRDPSSYPGMADPLLRNEFVLTSLNQAVGVAAMCLQEEPLARPLIADISAALGFLAMAPPEAPIPPRLVPILSSRVNTLSQRRDVDSSFGNNISKNEESSDSEDKDPECHQAGDHECKEDKSDSDYEYDDSSESSDGQKRG